MLANETEITAWAYLPLYDTDLFAWSPIPQAGLAISALSVLTCLTVWHIKRSPLDLGLAAAGLAFGIGMNGIATANVLPAFIMAAGLLLIIAVLQTTYHMAARNSPCCFPVRT